MRIRQWKILYPLKVMVRALRKLPCVRYRYFNQLKCYDTMLFKQYSGIKERLGTPLSRERQLAQIIVVYHILEKGLTMPNRRLEFGMPMVLELIGLVEKFLKLYDEDPQVMHAIGVLKAYDEMHQECDRTQNQDFWRRLEDFLQQYPKVQVATQPHYTREAFYAQREASFEAFARSRHTLRHYEGPLAIEKLRKAVELAMTTPTACNRQHARVYAISNHTLRDKILTLQNGNRGFGHLADKLLVVTADLADILGENERNDVFVNGGLFLMNLCYALHFYEVAHCILNWSASIERDLALRKLIPMAKSEVAIAILSCGEAPATFDVAKSPRRDVSTIYREL